MSGERSFVTAIAVLLLAAPLAAQSIPQNAVPQVPIAAAVVPASEAPAPVAAIAGPSVQTFGVVSRATVTAPSPLLAPLPADHPSDGVAMMVVGGAALIVGAVIVGNSGTIIMIGGGVFGLLGLWRYMQ
jgi:hypothetical protein